MIQRIQNAIRKAGLKELPDDPNVSLEDLGLDSLMMALIIAELEREFKTKIPVLQVSREVLNTPRTIEAFLHRLGVSA